MPAQPSSSRSAPPSPLTAEVDPRDLEPPPTAGFAQSPGTEQSSLYRGMMDMGRRPSMPRLRLGINTAAANAASAGPRTGVPLSIRTAVSEGEAVKSLGQGKERLGFDEIDSFPYENGPREVLPHIFLGSELNANDPAQLAQFRIGYVLNVAKDVACPWSARKRPRHSIILEDDEEATERGSPIDPVLASPASDMAVDPTPTVRGPQLAVPMRPSLMRATLSTPNLHSSFRSTPEPSMQPLRAHFVADPALGRPALEYLHLPWGHDEDRLATRQFPTAFAFMDEAAAKGVNVLVHCQCGVSRSATAVIAYVLRNALRRRDAPRPPMQEGEKMTFDRIATMHEAYEFVKDRSSFVNPNINLLFVACQITF